MDAFYSDFSLCTCCYSSFNIMRTLLLLCLFFGTFVFYASAFGANNPIADNELGLTAKACSSLYCNTKDGLGLWVSLEEICMAEKANPYLAKLNSVASSSTSSSEEGYSKNVVGMVCAFMGVVGLTIGYKLADKKMVKRHYQPI